MKYYALFFISYFLFIFASLGQSKLCINRPDFFDFTPLYKKHRLVQTIDSFLAVANEPEKGHKFWKRTDLDRWGYPGDFTIMSYNRTPFFLGAIDFIPKSKYLVKLAYISQNDTLCGSKLYSVYTFIANYNPNNDSFIFEHYSGLFTENWYFKKIGNISFYKEKRKDFNKQEAKACDKFNNIIASFFNVEPKEIAFYSCQSPVQYFQLKGYDFAPEMFFSRTGGTITYGGLRPPFRNIIYSGINREIYKHEIGHFYIDDYRDANTCRLANEGIATYLGGGTEKPLAYHLKTLYRYLISTPTFTIKNMLFDEKRISDTVSTLYATGGVLAKLIYEKDGLEGIKKFLHIPCEKMPAKLPELLGIKENNLYDYLLSELKKINDRN